MFLLSQNKDYKSYDKAVKYFNQGHHNNAKNLLLEIIDKHPEWNQPSLLMASIFMKENNLNKAVFYLLRVYNEDNIKDIDGIQTVGDLYYENGFYTEALYYFMRQETTLGCIILLI